MNGGTWLHRGSLRNATANHSQYHSDHDFKLRTDGRIKYICWQIFIINRLDNGCTTVLLQFIYIYIYT